MNAATARVGSFREKLHEASRRNLETTLGACDVFRAWHRQNFVERNPTLEQKAEHAVNIRILLMMLRWMQSAVDDPAMQLREFKDRIDATVNLLDDCWLYVNNPLSDEEADRLIKQHFPE
jgi:hypothetical protein